MGIEIERKFLVKDKSYKNLAIKIERIKQGYLSRVPERTVRVRTKGEHGYLTIKGKNVGAVRPEFEYEIPYNEAIEMLKLCEQPIIEKIRYEVPIQGYIWEIDEFMGRADNLITAEIELESENDNPEIPDFIGIEVTGDPQYYNSNL